MRLHIYHCEFLSVWLLWVECSRRHPGTQFVANDLEMLLLPFSISERSRMHFAFTIKADMATDLSQVESTRSVSIQSLWDLIG